MKEPVREGRLFLFMRAVMKPRYPGEFFPKLGTDRST